VIHGGYLEHICITDKPRNARLLNSMKNNSSDGDDDMSDGDSNDAYFTKRVEKHERELAVLNNKNEVLSNENKLLKDKISDYKKIEEEYNTKKEEYTQNQANAEKWVKYETEEKNKIVEVLAQDDKEYKEILEKMDLKDLKTMLKSEPAKPKGIGNAGGQIQDSNDNNNVLEKYKEKLESYIGYI